MTAATMEEAPHVGASDLHDLLEPEPLSASEAAAIVADFLERTTSARSSCGPVTRACRCRRPWKFERGHCGKCGHDLARPS